MGATGTAAPRGAGAIGEIRRRLADQHRDGVLERGARDADGELLRLRAPELRLGGDDVGLGDDADLVLVLRDGERALERRHGLIEELARLIGHAQVDVVGGERRLRRQPRGGELRLARLGVRDLALHGAADLAPQIHVPGGRGERLEGIGGMAGGRVA